MALRVVQAPGCRDIYSDDELGVRAGDVVIDTGDIAASLGYDPTSPTANKALLRVASRMRGVAIVAANDANLSGIVRTSNPRSVPRSARTDGHDDGDGDPVDARGSVQANQADFPE